MKYSLFCYYYAYNYILNSIIRNWDYYMCSTSGEFIGVNDLYFLGNIERDIEFTRIVSSCTGYV